MTNRKKKNVRFRGSKSHGYGSKKKHRGAGSRGGRGNAGSGKRADVKKPSYWTDTKYFGRHGFTSRQKKQPTLTIADLNRRAPKWLEQGLVVQEKGVLHVNLDSLGFTKLLSNGTPAQKYVITGGTASAAAERKIKEAGGTLETHESD